MKVLHLYAGNLYGGIEKILATIARETDGETMVSEFALCFEGRLSEELRAAGVPIHQLGAVRMSRPWTCWRARKQLLSIIKSQRIDVVVAHATWIWAIFGKTLKASRIPTAMWMHTQLSLDQRLDRMASRQKPDLMITLSKDIARSVPRVFGDLPTEVLYTPVPPPKAISRAEREAIRREMGVSENQVVIVQVSRMEAWKGHRPHIEALARLKALPDWVCWQIGGTQRPAEVTYRDSMRDLAAQLGIEKRVVFLGERRDVPRLLAAADIFCQPNLGAEGLGVVFLEALLSQLPVVTTNIGAAPEVVDSTCGRLIAANDVTKLAGTLAELIGDKHLRQELGSNGPARARELCDPVVQMKRLHDILEQLIEAKCAPAAT